MEVTLTSSALLCLFSTPVAFWRPCLGANVSSAKNLSHSSGCFSVCTLTTASSLCNICTLKFTSIRLAGKPVLFFVRVQELFSVSAPGVGALRPPQLFLMEFTAQTKCVYEHELCRKMHRPIFICVCFCTERCFKNIINKRCCKDSGKRNETMGMNWMSECVIVCPAAERLDATACLHLTETKQYLLTFNNGANKPNVWSSVCVLLSLFCVSYALTWVWCAHPNLFMSKSLEFAA